MIIVCLVVSVLAFAGFSVFGKKRWHQAVAVLMALVFFASLALVVLNDKEHFGMEKATTETRTNLISSGQKELPLLMYQPLGNGQEKVYLYKTEKEAQKLHKTPLEKITTKVETGGDQAVLVKQTTRWEYKDDLAKLFFEITDNAGQLDSIKETFQLPKGWSVMSTEQAKQLGAYMKEHQAEMKQEGQVFVQGKVMEAIKKSPSLATDKTKQQELIKQFTGQYQQQATEKALKTVGAQIIQ